MMVPSLVCVMMGEGGFHLINSPWCQSNHLEAVYGCMHTVPWTYSSTPGLTLKEIRL